jgi:hypothetical protein
MKIIFNFCNVLMTKQFPICSLFIFVAIVFSRHTVFPNLSIIHRFFRKLMKLLFGISLCYASILSHRNKTEERKGSIRFWIRNFFQVVINNYLNKFRMWKMSLFLLKYFFICFQIQSST